MISDTMTDLRQLRNERSDWLLTVLTGVLVLLIFVFAPLQAIGVYAFYLFAVGLLLVIIGSMVIISDSPTTRSHSDVGCACCQSCRISPAT